MELPQAQSQAQEVARPQAPAIPETTAAGTRAPVTSPVDNSAPSLLNRKIKIPRLVTIAATTLVVGYYGFALFWNASMRRERGQYLAARQPQSPPNVKEEQFGASVQPPTDGTYVILRRKETTEPNYLEVDYVAQVTASATAEQRDGWCAEVTAKEEKHSDKGVIVNFVRDDGSSTWKNMGGCVGGSLLRDGNGNPVTE